MEKPRWHEIDKGKSYVISGRRLRDLLRRSTDVKGTDFEIAVTENADGGVSIGFASARFCYLAMNGGIVKAMIPIAVIGEV